jgi:hypothetical protein
MSSPGLIDQRKAQTAQNLARLRALDRAATAGLRAESAAEGASQELRPVSERNLPLKVLARTCSLEAAK